MMKSFLLLLLAAPLILFSSIAAPVVAQIPSPAPQTPAVIDTALVEITLPEGAPSCLSVAVTSDTLGFGVAGLLKLEFSSNEFKPTAENLEISSPWLKLSPARISGNSGQVVFDVYVYRLNPFQIKVGQTLGPVVFVSGSTTDLSDTAAIRMPRIWASRWWLLIIPALLLTFFIMGLWWLWQRRLRLEPLDQWHPEAPAWLQASVDLKNLVDGDYPDPVTSRIFLDRLATICRSYLAGRYLVHAGEMTSGEILDSCRMKGHDSRSLRKMVKILQDLDHNRYDLEPPVATWCRAQAKNLVDTIENVRILPRYTQVEAGLLVEAEIAWSWLKESENILPGMSPVSGGEE